MHAALLIALIASADPALPPSPASPPAPALAGGPVHGSGPALPGATLPVLLVAGAAAAVLVFARRRSRQSRFVQVLETASLGPRRALVVARLGDQLLLLGTSEAGIHLLSSQPASADVHAAGDALAARIEPPASPEPIRIPLLSRLRRREAAATPAFEALLSESAEDQELRRKLSRGQAGSVP